jgi:glucose/arabinose dehydrogenase
VAAAIAGSLAIALAATQTFGAPSNGLKEPPTAKLKNFEIDQVAQGFDEPTSFDWLPDGTMLVAEREGDLVAVTREGIKVKILDISGHVATARERGLGTVEVASDFATSRRVYLSYTYLVDPKDPDGPQSMRLVSIRLNPNDTVADPSSPETVVLGKDATEPCPPVSNKLDCPPSINSTHQAGNVVSDPDGTLWVSYGDSNLPSNPGLQDFRVYNPASTSGKLLHIDAKGNGLPGHPFCRKDDDLSHTCTKIYAMGFRNPYRFTLGDDKVPFLSDVGWNTKEELDFVKPGRNYGWPCYEGDVKTPFYRDLGSCHTLYSHSKQERIAKPLLAFKNPTTGAGAAVIAGPVYPGGGGYPPKFTGSYFFGDYAGGFIKRLTLGKKGGKRVQLIARGVTPVDFGIAPDGNLAFVDYRRGSIRELVYSPANKAPVPQIAASPSSGYTPLKVNFSSTGTTDPDGDAVSYDWDFGDGSPHGTGPYPSHTYGGADGIYTVKLTVSDGKGGTAVTRTTVTLGDDAPTAKIILPAANTFSVGGQPTPMLATGSDPEDGPLPDSAFHWDVILHHKDHIHPEGLTTGASSFFTAVHDHDANAFYIVTLTVTDSQGLSTTLPPVIVQPSVVSLRVGSNLKGVKLSYGGSELKTPSRFKAAIGFDANLSAPATLKRNGREYRFDHWTQGGKRSQIYEIPSHASRVRAIFKLS